MLPFKVKTFFNIFDAEIIAIKELDLRMMHCTKIPFFIDSILTIHDDNHLFLQDSRVNLTCFESCDSCATGLTERAPKKTFITK